MYGVVIFELAGERMNNCNFNFNSDCKVKHKSITIYDYLIDSVFFPRLAMLARDDRVVLGNSKFSKRTERTNRIANRSSSDMIYLHSICDLLRGHAISLDLYPKL